LELRPDTQRPLNFLLRVFFFFFITQS
jgi:hypothetical protein